MFIGAIADDLTGATDLSLTLAREGMKVLQVIGVPDPDLDFADAEAVVVSLKSRTIPAQEAVTMSLASARVLREWGARQFLFKYCSTFDSTDQGNIGPVADALMDFLETNRTIACPAFPATGRTVYRGHLFIGDQLLSESSMKDHPLTPMRDPNLVRVLGFQSRNIISLVPREVVAGGDTALKETLDTLSGIAIVDATDDTELRAIGRAARDFRLITGGSGIALGLPANFLPQGRSLATIPLPVPKGRTVFLAGSCSAATRRQVASAMEAGVPAFKIDAIAIAEGRTTVPHAFNFIMQSDSGLPALIWSSADPEEVKVTQDRLGRDHAGALIEAFLAELAGLLASQGFNRFIIAGGETSGAVVNRLGARALEIGPEIDPGVPWTRSRGTSIPMALALKSGNFGADEFFESVENVAMSAVLSETTKMRDLIAEVGRSLFDRGFTHGSTGNISVRLSDGTMLMTPTNASLGALEPERISHLDHLCNHLGGDKPTKEAFLHSCMYCQRPDAQAVVHLHSTYSVAASVRADLDPSNVLPPLTAYYVMRVGRLPLVPYFAPGDRQLAIAVEAAAKKHHSVLMANHGPVVSGRTLRDAQYATEELEETAKLFMILDGKSIRALSEEQVAEFTAEDH